MPWIMLYLVVGAAVTLWIDAREEPSTPEVLAVILFWPLLLVSAGIATLVARHNRKAG